MQMSEEEICFRFKRNGCQKRHIEILAELNDVKPEVIEDIIRRGGIETRTYFRYNQMKKQRLKDGKDVNGIYKRKPERNR